MMKPIDDEKRGLKLESLMELIKEMKSGNLDKLPKGKGISMMSISVSKPKKDTEMPEDMEEMSEAPEMEEGMEEMSEEAPKMSKEASEEDMEEMSEAPEMEEEEMEEEDEYKLPEPAIPEDLMKLVMEMMKNKQKG